MANAGGAWDNAKKVEVELKAKGTPLHDATVVGDTVGDPFSDTSVALNPVIKFTTLFGLLAVELAVKLTNDVGANVSHMLAALFFIISLVFVWRSFYGMRIGSEKRPTDNTVRQIEMSHASEDGHNGQLGSGQQSTVGGQAQSNVRTTTDR
jgi:K(+)-stimulated pyrophosphate-energized sodium pump